MPALDLQMCSAAVPKWVTSLAEPTLAMQSAECRRSNLPCCAWCCHHRNLTPWLKTFSFFNMFHSISQLFSLQFSHFCCFLVVGSSPSFSTLWFLIFFFFHLLSEPNPGTTRWCSGAPWERELSEIQTINKRKLVVKREAAWRLLHRLHRSSLIFLSCLKSGWIWLGVRLSVVVPVSGSAVRAVFFPLTTTGFVPTVNGQPHRGISPPKPALWSRPQLGKNWLRLSLCVPSLTLQPLLQHLHRRRGSCRCFCLHPSCLLIHIHPSVHPVICLSASPFVWHVCLTSSFCRFSASCQIFSK